MKMRKFMVYLDDGTHCYKVAVPAKDRKDAEKFCEGNGEIIAVKDVTEDIPISIDCVTRALNMAGFGNDETDLIIRTLLRCRIAE